MKSDIAHQLLLKLYLRTPSMIQQLVNVELDNFLAGASVTGNMNIELNIAILDSFLQYESKKMAEF